MGITQALLMVQGGTLGCVEFFLEFEQNDASTTFIDSAGNWDFTARTTSGTAATSSMSTNSGISGRGGFTNNTEGNCIYIPLAAGFQLPDSDWTFGLWCRTLTATGGTARFLMGNVGATGADYQAHIAISGVDNQYHFTCTTNGSNSGATDLDSTYNPHTTDWTLLSVTLDRTNDQMVMRVQRVGSSRTTVSTAFTGALYTGSTTANFSINDGLSSDSTYFSGNRACVVDCDKAFLIYKAISDSDFDYLYNGGNGRSYSELGSLCGS